MRPTTLELLQQHLATPCETTWIAVRDFVTTKSGTRLSVQVSHFHYCRPREDVGPYTCVEVMHPDAPESWKEYNDLETIYAYVPIEVVAAEIDRLGGFEEQS